MVRRFGTLKNPIRNWFLKDIKNILDCCMILHNVCVETNKDCFVFNDKRDENMEEEDKDAPMSTSLFSITKNDNGNGFFQQELAERVAHMATAMEDKAMHQSLQEDLIEHIWNGHGLNGQCMQIQNRME